MTVHLPVVVFPKVSVSPLTRHVKHCEGQTTPEEEKTENFYRGKKMKHNMNVIFNKFIFRSNKKNHDI